MGKERTPMDAKEIEAVVSDICRKNKFSNDSISLIKSDLEYGLTVEEVRRYTNVYRDVRQMKIMSDCIKNELPKQAVALICKRGMRAGQMEFLYSIYMETKNLEYVKDIYIESNGNVGRMKNIHKKTKEKADSRKEDKVTDENVAEKTTIAEERDVRQEVVTETMQDESEEYAIEDVDWDDDSDEELYDEEELQARISEANKAAEAEKQQLIERIAEKDGQIENIQNQFNSCFSENKKLSREIGELKEQLANERAANERLIELKKEDEKKAEEIKPEPVKAESEEKAEPEKKTKPEEEAVMEKQVQTPVGIPIYYPVNIVDIYGNVIGTTVPERQEKKTSSFGGIISRLLFKRKTRIDIVKLVSSSELTAEQLCLIKSAIGNGLTDKQIETLVQNKLSPDRMKEVIEIAVLEKGMA